MLDEDWQPGKAEIEDYAAFIGINVASEQDLLWIAEEGLKAPVPEGWVANTAEDGSYEYTNLKTNER